MKIYSVLDEAFRPYGSVLTGYDTAELLAAMEAIALPETGKRYLASIETLEACSVFPELQNRAFGGMPIQLGMCWGRNTALNALEYHRDSELNIGTHDFILLLAKRAEIVNGRLDTARIQAFRVPAGVLVEVFADTLHYAPCHVDEADGFRAAVVLPRGTNTEKPEITPRNDEDALLWAKNKWLIAHPDSPEVGRGAYPGLMGANLDLADEL